MQTPGSIARKPSVRWPSVGRRVRTCCFRQERYDSPPIEDPLGDILRSAALSPAAPCSHASDALLLRCSDAEVGQDRASGVEPLLPLLGVLEVLKFRRILPNSETPRSESNIENLLLQPHPEEVRQLAGGEGPVVAALLERHRRRHTKNSPK